MSLQAMQRLVVHNQQEAAQVLLTPPSAPSLLTPPVRTFCSHLCSHLAGDADAERLHRLGAVPGYVPAEDVRA